jgi:hypothetical protein
MRKVHSIGNQSSSLDQHQMEVSPSAWSLNRESRDPDWVFDFTLSVGRRFNSARWLHLNQ